MQLNASLKIATLQLTSSEQFNILSPFSFWTININMLIPG